MFASLAVAGMIGTHRLLQTWQREVDAFVVLSKHAHGVFQTAGLPVNRLHIKPNFADDPGPEVVDLEPRAGAIYVGRLSAEKGVQTLINAWSGSPGDLVVAGAGPLAGELASLSSAGVRFVGQVGAEAIPSLLRRATFAVVPSEWYEPFGRAVVEAYACGTPVLAARVGALPELVIDGVTGLLFEPGDASDLAKNANWLATHPAEARRMGRAARALFEERFSESANYPQLIEVYRAAEAAFSARRVG